MKKKMVVNAFDMTAKIPAEEAIAPNGKGLLPTFKVKASKWPSHILAVTDLAADAPAEQLEPRPL